MSHSRGRAAVVVLVLLLAVGLAAGNLVLYAQAAMPAAEGVQPILGDAVRGAYERYPNRLLYFALSPLLAGLVVALVAGLTGGPAAAAAVPEREEQPAGPAVAPHASALRLLALLQQEGRLIDFLQEDIEGYDDAQVGAAVRAIHAGCRKALLERVRIERILADDDGASVQVASGFDPARIRLTGNVHGEPPFRGTLQHGGWRAADVKLPETPAGFDASVLEPAEVEIG